MASTSTVLEWATQFYCSKDDHEIVKDLLHLRQCDARDASTSQSTTPPHLSKGSRRAKRGYVDAALANSKQPIYVLLYDVRRLLHRLGPSYLGLVETEQMLDGQQPWASPLNLHKIAKHPPDTDIGSSDEHRPFSKSSSILSPFSSTFDVESGDGSPQLQHSGVVHDGAEEAEPVDVPALIYSLITIENARRHFASELLNRKHSQGSKGDQSERWQHHFAKRNLAAETKFENVLVALKELVVLRAIADPDTTQVGELKLGLGRISSQERRRSRGAASTAANALGARDGASSSPFDAAQCLAILNLMFPLDPLHADRRKSIGTNMWQQRYAFPLQHVPNPRAQLHQLLCEVESWVNSGGHSHRLDGSGNMPSNCPAWQASARGLAWGQIKQSCLAYLRDASQKIAGHHRILHPWASSLTTIRDATAGREVHVVDSEGEERLQTSTAIAVEQQDPGDDRTSRTIDYETKLILRTIEQQLAPGATTIERIVHHSQAISRRFSPYAVFDRLSK
ncbi:hypothetical protein GGI12_001561 [Dipsacomyces acuminosporus]|nr:hypothetical protein GGI12_001561 [Dipsacomyces acuminosporus]